ncbi:MAG: PEP-CTERM sorting domain-containing protein [Coleofasciculus sp. C2-GNP5-27]
MNLIRNKLITTSLAVGASVISFGVLSQPASAVNVNFVQEGGNPPDGWTNLNWTLDGRAGAKGSGDWELGIGEDNFPIPKDQFHWDWQNQQEVPWTLDWDGNTVSFTIQEQTISYYQATPPATSFNGFYLWTRSQTEIEKGKVAPGTEMFLQVDAINGIDIDPVSSSAVAPETQGNQNITKNYFSSDTQISTLSGIARMSWLDGAPNPNQAQARSRVELKIEGFSTPSTPVPEPLTLLGSATALGFGALFKRQYSKQRKSG